MKRVNVSMPDHVFDLVEEARMREPRSAFVARMLESVLSEAKGPESREQAAPGPVGSDEVVAPPSEEPVRAAAPTRAPVDRTLASALGERAQVERVATGQGPATPSAPPGSTRTPESDVRLVPATGVRNESDGAMVPPSPVVAPSGSNPEPPLPPPPDPEPDPNYELPRIAPRGWAR